MKILIVDLEFDYGMKHRGKNTICEIGFKQVFQKLGHDVVCFYYDDYLNNTEKLQTDLLKYAEEQKPDLIYFSLFGEQFKEATLDHLRQKYKTINWFGDDQWRFDNFTSKYAPLFTYSVTTDPFAVPKYKKLGVSNVFLSQWAALDLDVKAATDQYKYDISFVGGSHSVRRWFVSEFRKAGLHVETFGYGWPAGPVSLDQMVEIFRISKISLNLSNSINYDLRYLTHNLKNIIVAMKNTKDVSQVKARNFEIPYYGGFQLTDYVPTMETYFDIGSEVVCYANVDEAILQARFYLENDDVREAIKRKAIAKARDRHTYFSRHKDIFSQL